MKINKIEEKSFPIASVSKEDIIYNMERKYKRRILKLTEADMQIIASKMADDYLEQLYWGSLTSIVKEYLENSIK